MLLIRDLKLLINELDGGDGSTLFDSAGTLNRNEASPTVASRYTGARLVVPANGSLALPLAPLTRAHFLLIVADKDLDLTFNGGSEILPLKPSPGTTGGRAMLYWEGDFTGVSLANPGSEDATVLYAALGV